MTQKEIMDILRPKIAWQLGVPEKAVKRTAAYYDDLGADEMDVVTLIMMVEDTFDITVNEQLLFPSSIYEATVWDSIRCIQRKLKGKR